MCLGTYGDPRGVGVFNERGTPVEIRPLEGGVGRGAHQIGEPRWTETELNFLASKQSELQGCHARKKYPSRRTLQ